MSNAKRIFWASLIALSLAWWITDRTDWGALTGFIGWRNVMSQYTGMLGMGVMSLAMLLAVRPVAVEPWLGGLDKMYRLHKWLGISGLVVAITHWLIAKAPKWAVALGWLERRARGPRPALDEGSLQQLLMSQRGLAEAIGEWAFYVAAALIVLALVKRFPYRRFFQTHKLLAVTYLALVFHAVVLFQFDSWIGLSGVLLAVLMLAGSIAAVMVLAGRHVGAKRIAGTVTAIERHEDTGVTAIDIALDGGWQGHEAGQFAFVGFHDDEGPHPFTIASCWEGDGRIRILVKALGDYTQTLSQRIAIGDRVDVEGPYGRFNFEGKSLRQIWIGGGIGITPFIARMQQLARLHDGRAVDLFHATSTYDAATIDRLSRDAEEAKVRLHVLWDARDGLLDAQRLVSVVPDWRTADVWFCGPAKFGRMLRDGLLALGLPEARFHQELFDLR